MVRIGTEPRRIGHKSVQSFQNDVRTASHVIPSELWTISLKAREGVGSEGIPEVIDKRVRSGVASFLFIIV